MKPNSEWNPDAERRIDELTAAAIDGRISPAEQEELAGLLTAHEEARDAFLAQMDVEAMLRAREYRVGQASFSLSPPSVPFALPFAPPVAPPFPWWKSAILAASLLAAVGAAVWGLWPRPALSSPVQVATLVQDETVVWGADSPGLLPHAGVGLGRLSLERGTAQMTTDSAVELTLTAPCEIEFLNPRTVKVHRGRLKARIQGDSAVGFRVMTPTADVVDLGTEFGVFVEQDGSSEVHVFQGVVVARAFGTEQVIPIYRNEAGRVAAEQRASEDPERLNVYRPGSLVAVAARPDLFGQSVPAQRAEQARATAPLPRDARVLFLGDPYLDDDLPLQLIEQAWCDAGWAPAPRLINGFVPDWIHQYAERFEHHVLRFRPTHAVVSFGPQYAWKPEDRIAPQKYAADLTALVELLANRGIEPILATGYRFRSQDVEAQQMLDRYNDEVRRLAERKGLRLADVDLRCREAGEAWGPLVDARGNLASFAGDQILAGAMLEALGHRDLAVPKRLELQMLAGVIKNWQFQLLPLDREPLSPALAAGLRPDDSWKNLALPQEDRFTPRLAEPSHSRLCRERASGYATHLTTSPHPVWRGVANLDAAAPRGAYLHVGAGIQQVWLNGAKVFDERSTLPAHHGHHAGYETAAIQLQAGENRLVAECSGSFFLSVTDTSDPPRRVLGK